MSDLHFDDIPWQIRMERLVERLAKRCTGCMFKGARCAECDCATAAGIVRDRASDPAAVSPERAAKMKPATRRMRVAGNMAGRGWLKPADILWPCETPPNVRTMDLESLVKSGIAERYQPDVNNERVFMYRRVEE